MSESNKTFDDLIAGDKPTVESSTPKTKKRTKKVAVPTQVEPKPEPVVEETVSIEEPEKIEVVASEGSEYVTTKVEAPVDDPAYAIEYYQGSPKNWGAASVWFGFAYLIIGFSVMWLSSMLNNFLATVKITMPSSIGMGLFILVGLIGAISVICAIVGFFRAKKYDHKWWLGLAGLGTVAVTAVSTWILFV